MKTSVQTVQHWINLLGIHRLLLATAALMFVAMLSLYVHLLHHSVARGESLRQEQRLGIATNKPQPASRGRMARENSALALGPRR